MKAEPTLRATLYLLFSFLGIFVGGFLSHPFSSLCHLLLVLLALLTEKRFFEGDALPRANAAALWKCHRLWLIYPAFLLATLALNLLSAKWTVALGGTLPDKLLTPSVFVGAVLIAPIAEELLFRGLLLRLFHKFGDVWAITLSALLFAFAHASLFQMPYALIAGLFLGFFAIASEGVLFPIFAHFLYNLLAFFGEGIPQAALLWSLAALTLFSSVLFFLGEHPRLSKKGEKPRAVSLLPLVAFAALMTALAILKF